MNILKISFQYSTCTGKETPFRSEIDKTTSSKQTRSSYERKEIKTLVIFRTLFAQVSADSIRTHACSRIKYIVFYYSEQLIANVTPCFLQAVQFSFGLLCMVRGFASLLRSRYLGRHAKNKLNMSRCSKDGEIRETKTLTSYIAALKAATIYSIQTLST